MAILSCIQLNLHHAIAASAHLMHYLNETKIDVAFLQEPYCRNGQVSFSPNNVTVFSITTEENPRAAIVITKKLANKAILINRYSNRDQVVIKLTLPGLQTYLVSTYLPSDGDLLQDLSPIQQFLINERPKNIVWCLDSNCKHVSWYSPVTDRRGITFFDFLKEYNLFTINEESGPTFSGARGKSWIDITVTSPTLLHKLTCWSILPDDFLSDHEAIGFQASLDSTVDLRRGTESSTRRYATHKGNLENFKSRVQVAGKRWQNELIKSSAPQELNQLVNNIWAELEQICSNTFPPFRPTNKYVAWWTQELSIQRKRTNAAKRRLKRCKINALVPIYQNQYLEIRRNYQAMIKEAKQNSWKIFCQTVNSSNLWKLNKTCKNNFSKKAIPRTLRREDGTETLSSEDTAEALLEKFFPEDRVDDDTIGQRHARAKSEEEWTSTSPNERDFSNDEVNLVIESLPTHKAPGPDGLDENITKLIHTALPSFWRTLFNKCLQLGCFPNKWKEASIAVIPKTDKNKLSSVNGYRGISLLSIPGKCFEKLTVKRLSEHLIRTGNIKQQQYGFKTGLSTEMAIRKVVEFTQDCKTKNLRSCIVALDFKGAFDNAWHPKILAMLKHYMCPGNIFRIIKSFLSDRSATLEVADSISSKRTSKGCPQGSVSGPTLWNLIADDLIDILTQFKDSLNVVMYADDLILLIKGSSHDQIIQVFDRVFHKIEEWSEENKLDIAKEKSAIMPMFCRKVQLYRSHPIVKNSKLNVVSQLPYLGVILDSKLSWNAHTTHLYNKSHNVLRALIRCSKTTWGLSFNHLVTIYKYCLIPMLTYASSVWYNLIRHKTQMNTLVKLQRQILIFMTKSYRSVSTEALTVIANVLPLELEIKLRNDIRALGQGQKPSAVIPETTKVEIPQRNGELSVLTLKLELSETGGVGDYTIYTDGSKTEDNVGAGMVVYRNGSEIFSKSMKLNHQCTVFQAEIQGVQMAVNWIKYNWKQGTKYVINVDSQAALKAITTTKSTNPAVIQIRVGLYTLNPNQVTFHWIRGHTGHHGNERADYLAKVESRWHNTVEYDKLPLSLCKQKLAVYYKNLWNKLYISSPKAIHTKLFFPDVHCRQKTNILPTFILTQFLTNHGKFLQYLHRIGKTISPVCPCEEDNQTAIHLLTRCRLLDTTRPRYLQNATYHLYRVLINPKTASFILQIYETISQQNNI